MKRKRKDSTTEAREWFRKYLNTIITEREAREFLARLPDAIKDLHRLEEIVAHEK